MDNLPPEPWAELMKAWPLGGMALLFLTLMWRPIAALFSALEDRHDTDADLVELLSNVTALRAEIREEFRELKTEQREARVDIGNIRDRVARLEGAAGREQR